MKAALIVSLAALCACGTRPPLGPEYLRHHIDDVPDSGCVAWVDRHFTYAVDTALRPTADADHAAISAAVASWQTVSNGCSDFQFAEDGGSKANLVVIRTRNCIDVAPPNDPCLANDSCATMYNCWDQDTMTLGLTTLTYSTSTGAMKGAEIQLDAANWTFTTVDSPVCADDKPALTCVSTDVQNTVTHELGHVLGFDHVHDPGSTMAATAPLGETSKRVIDPGTRDGFCAVYPKGAPTPSCLAP